MEYFDIDFVLPWVDESDPTWRESYNQFSYLEEKALNLNEERFRDWGLLRFWFRGVENYAPWVRKIHFVTCGHYPPWLDLNHPKIHFVKHSDYIPSQYLPTFSSIVIENNIHRIDGLADHFVLFNDDVFLSAPVRHDSFFKKGLPREAAVRNFIWMSRFGHNQLNDILLINKHLAFWPSYKKNLWKWFNYRYGLGLLRNFYFIRYHDFIGIKQWHMANPFLKSTFQDVWDSCADELDETCKRKFRSIHDVNQYLFQYWQLATGSFYPKRYNYGCLSPIDDIHLIKRTLSQKRKEQLCINDNAWADISGLKKELQNIFVNVFPEKSSFELY